jgi:hypothetical protein
VPHTTSESRDAAWRDRHRRSAASVSIAVLALLYAVLAFAVLEPDATYAVDSTVKLVQARTLLENGFLQSGIAYRASYIDPAASFTPFTSPYVFHTPDGWQSIFSTAGALLIAPFSPWGLAGITIPALLGAVLLLWATTRLARGVPGESWAPLLLGTATILWFYATSPNEHGIATALTTLALLAALEHGDRASILSGLLLGSAAALRDEAVLVAPGLVVARMLAGSSWTWRTLARHTVLAGAGSLAPLVAVALLDGFVYHRPAWAHMLYAVPGVRQWLPGDVVRGLPPLRVLAWGRRPEVLVHQWLIGIGTPVQKGLVVALLASAWLWLRRTRSALALLLVVAGLAAWRVADVVELVSAPKFVGGLYRLCPFLLFAIVPLPPGEATSLARRLALWTTGTYLVLAFAGLNIVGGKSFGPRLLFPLLPLLTVAALEAIAAWLARARTSRVAGGVGITGLVLVATSIVMQFAVALPAWTERNRSDYAAIARVATATDLVVVIDHPSAVQLTASFYDDKVVMLATSQPRATALAERLASARTSAFVVLSRFTQPPLTFAPYNLASEAREGRLVVQRWVR